MSKKLPPNQEIFKNEWLIDRNGTRAAFAAYPRIKNENVAAATASRLLRNVKIKAAINEALEKQKKRLEISADRTLLEIARLAFSDKRKLYNDDGTFKKIAELDDDTAAALHSFKVTKQITGGGVAEVTEIRLHTKDSSLEKLAKHFNLYSDSLLPGDGSDIESISINFNRKPQAEKNE